MEPEEDPAPQRSVTGQKVNVHVRDTSPKKKRRNWRKIIWYSVLTAVFAIAALLYAVHKITDFYEHKTIKFDWPIIFQLPVRVVPREHSGATESKDVGQRPQAKLIQVAEAAGPVPTVPATTARTGISQNAKDGISDIPTTQIADIIWRLESGRTNSDGCEAKATFNGYGYIPGTCYKTHEQVKLLVEKWVDNHRKLGISKMLCTYNLGGSSKYLPECMSKSAEYPYYRDFLRFYAQDYK